MAIIDDITALYVGYFNRAPDPAGLNFWVAQRNAGASLSGIAQSFSQTPEAQSLYGFLSAPLVGSAATFLSSVYLNLFGRVANATTDAAGFAYWTAQLNNPAVPVGRVIVDIISGATGTDAQVVANKSAVGKNFAAELTNKNLSFNAAAQTAAKAAFNGVTSDAATVTTANAAIAVALSATGTVGGNVTGSTFALTTGVDNASGSFIDGSRALTVAGAFDTLTSSDTVAGTAGTNDTLFAQFTQGIFSSPVSITAIENLTVENVGANAAVLDLSNGDNSITKVKIANTTTNSMTVQNVQSAVSTLEVANTNQTLTLGIAAARLSGTTDAINISLSTVNSGTLVVGNTGASGYETFNITSSGALINGVGGTLTVGDGSSTSLATVNVTGTAGLNMTLSDASVTTVNASTLTGRINLVVATGSGAQTITGTAANDTINMNGTYTAADVLNAGAGTDILVLSNAEAIAATTAQAGVTLFETLNLSTALNGTVTPGNFGVSTLVLTAGTGGASVVNFATGTAGNLQLGSVASGGTLTVNVAGAAINDALALTIGTTTTGNTFGANAVTINGAETVNLLSQGAANSFGAAFTLTATAASETIVITGGTNLTFGAAVTADSINASAFTGALTMSASTVAAGGVTITGGSGADTLFGSGVNDVISGGAGNDRIIGSGSQTALVANQADILTGGAGVDTFVFFDTLAGAATVSNATAGTLTSVTDFVAGTDKFTLITGGPATSVVVNATQTIATAANIAAVSAGITAITASVANGALQAAVINVTAGAAAGTYLYVNDTTGAVNATNDLLINITGLSGTIAAADFLFA